MVTVESKTANLKGFSVDAVEALSASKQEPAWMRAKRLAAWEASQDLSLPSGMEEEWRRTDIRGAHLDTYLPLPPQSQAVQHPSELPEVLAQQMALPETQVGGRVMHQDGAPVWSALDEELQQRGVVFCDLDTAVRQHAELVQPHFMTSAIAADSNKFTALHGALWNGGVFLYVPRGIALTLPLQALTAHATEAGMIQPHTLVVADEQSQVTLIDEQLSTSPTLSGLHNGVVELHLKAGAHVTYLQLQDWSRRLWGFANQRAVLAADSHLRWATAGLGSRLHWTSMGVELREPGSSSRLFGLTLTDSRQHLDYQTCQDHLAPHTESDLVFKSALLDRSRTVFRGLIRLHPIAQQTNAYQANHNLLLSRKARADALPILEIEADDVRCKHGSTTGRIDDEQVFYLMSRGLSYQEAQRMIVQGFFETVITEFPVEGVQEKIRLAVNDRI
jgi:Fe-S cluster assembly protein SufD